MTSPPIVLVHGAATTSAVWSRVVPLLDGPRVLTPERPCSGDLAEELAFLRPECEGSLVVGVGGGATLGLAMLAAGFELSGALLHEPAAGSLVPGLLDGVATAYSEGGIPGFGRALYGSSWQPSMAPSDAQAVRRDFTMFRAFEPLAPLRSIEHVVTTVGQHSTPLRFEVADALQARFGLSQRILAGCGHAVHLEAPMILAAEVHRLLSHFR